MRALAILSAIAFAFITIVLSIFSIPAALLDRNGRSYLWLARIWSRSFLVLFNVKVTVQGLGNLRGISHCVFVANHSSYADIPIVLASIPLDIRLVLRKSLTRIPVWGWALLVSPFIVMDRSSGQRSRDSIEKAAESIRKGASVLLFPEGTRTSTGEIQEFKRGAFRLAFESSADVVPLAIKGAYELLPRTGTLPNIGCSVTLRIGAGIPFKGYTIISESATARDVERQMMKDGENAVRKLLNETQND